MMSSLSKSLIMLEKVSRLAAMPAARSARSALLDSEWHHYYYSRTIYIWLQNLTTYLTVSGSKLNSGTPHPHTTRTRSNR